MILSLVSVVFFLFFYEANAGFVGKLKGFFGGGSTSSDETAEAAENVPPRKSETSSASSAAPSAAPSPSANTPPSTTPEKKVTLAENTIALTVNVKFTSTSPLTVGEKKVSRNKYVYNTLNSNIV